MKITSLKETENCFRRSLHCSRSEEHIVSSFIGVCLVFHHIVVTLDHIVPSVVSYCCNSAFGHNCCVWCSLGCPVNVAVRALKNFGMFVQGLRKKLNYLRVYSLIYTTILMDSSMVTISKQLRRCVLNYNVQNEPRIVKNMTSTLKWK